MSLPLHRFLITPSCYCIDLLLHCILACITWYLGDENSHLGPGVYTTSKGLGLGEDVKGVVPFEKLVARRDAIGPFGEKSEAAAEELHEAIGDDYYRDNPLDYEAGQLREIIYGRVPMFELYKTERPGQGKEKPIEYPAQEKLGGTWFEGMAEVVAKQRPVVRIDRMIGRDDHADDDAVLNDAPDGGLKGEGHTLPLVSTPLMPTP